MTGPAETVTLRVTLRYATLDEFIERHAEHVSSAGLFIRTRSPKETGTKVHFELKLADGRIALGGTGVVVSVRSDDRPGMSLRFSELSDEAQSLIDRLIETHGEGALAPTPLALKLPGSSTDILQRGWATGDLALTWPVADYSGVSATGPLLAPTAPPETSRATAEAPVIPSTKTMPPFESASADLAEPSSAGAALSEPDPPPPTETNLAATEDVPAASEAARLAATDDVPTSTAAPEDDIDLEFEDAIGFEGSGDDPLRVDGRPQPTRVEPPDRLHSTADVDTDETSFAGLLDGREARRTLVADGADGTDGADDEDGADGADDEGPTGDLVTPSSDSEAEGERTPSASGDAFEARTEIAPPPAAPSEADVQVDVDEAFEDLPGAIDGDATHETSTDAATDPHIRVGSEVRGPPADVAPPHDRSADLVEDEIRAVGIEVDARRIRIGTLEHGEFRWLTPAVGLPGLVALLPDGRRVVGSRAERQAEEHIESAVAPMEILLGVRGGKLIDASQPVLDWGPRGGQIQLGEQTIAAYDALVELARCAHGTIDEALASEPYRAFVKLPPGLDDGCVSLLRTAFREAGLSIAEFDAGPKALLTAFGLDERSNRHTLVVSIDETRTELAVTRGARTLSECVLDDVSARAIDDHIVGLIITALLQSTKEDHRGDPSTQIRLREAVAIARNDLKRTPQVDVETTLPGEDGRLTPRAFKLDRTQIYQSTRETTDRLQEATLHLLREAGVDPRSLSAVVLAGEGASFPPFEQVLARMTDKEPSKTSPPVQARVLGLAKMGRAAQRDVVARRPDTLDQSVGVGLPGGRFKVLVPSGAKLPVKVVRVQPLRAGQTDFSLGLLQGNGELTASCSPLGDIGLQGLPRSADGLKIRIALEVGENGVLEVELKEESSGQARSGRFATSQAKEAVPPSSEQTDAPEPEPAKGFLGKLFGRS